MLIGLAVALTPALAALPEHGPVDCQPGFRGPRPPSGPDTLSSELYPILLHYDAAASADQQERAEATLAAVEISWQIQVDELGFQPPVVPDAEGTPAFDIYLIEYIQGAAFVAADDYVDRVEGDGRNGTSSYMVVDDRLPLPWVDSYLAHEFNHACQWATDFSERSYPIWEGVATAAQDWTFGDDGRWDLDVASFQEAAAYPTLVATGTRPYNEAGLGYYFEYGAAMWVMWLDESFGDGTGTMGAALWDATANEGMDFEPDAVDAFVTVTGMDLGDALNELAVVRFLTGADWDERGLSDAASWGPEEAVPAAPVDGPELPWAAQPLPVQPYVTGQSYVDVDLSDRPLDGTLTVQASSPSGLGVALVVLWWDDAGQAGHTGTWSAYGATTVALDAAGLSRIVLAVTNLGPVDYDGDDDPYVAGDFLVDITLPEATPADTGTPTSTPTTDTPPPRGSDVEEAAGCGCAAAPTPWIRTRLR